MRKNKGSITIEASLILPIFLFFAFGVVYILMHAGIKSVRNTVSPENKIEYIVNDELKKTVDNIRKIDEAIRLSGYFSKVYRLE